MNGAFFTYKHVAMAQSMKILSRLRLPSMCVGEAIPQVRSPYTRGQSLTFNHVFFSIEGVEDNNLVMFKEDIVHIGKFNQNSSDPNLALQTRS